MPLDGKSRMQVNMMVRKSNTLSQLATFKDGSILPIAWFDVVSIFSKKFSYYNILNKCHYFTHSSESRSNFTLWHRNIFTIALSINESYFFSRSDLSRN